jgi:hypothetical protein
LADAIFNRQELHSDIFLVLDIRVQVKKLARQFIKNVVNLLKKHDVVIADKYVTLCLLQSWRCLFPPPETIAFDNTGKPFATPQPKCHLQFVYLRSIGPGLIARHHP